MDEGNTAPESKDATVSRLLAPYLAPSKAPGVTREWAMRLLGDRTWSTIAFPERTGKALQRYCHPDHPAPPASQPTRSKPSQSTTQAKQGGGNRPLSSGNTPSFTERSAAWYETARRTLRFKGGVSGGVLIEIRFIKFNLTR